MLKIALDDPRYFWEKAIVKNGNIWRKTKRCNSFGGLRIPPLPKTWRILLVLWVRSYIRDEVLATIWQIPYTSLWTARTCDHSAVFLSGSSRDVGGNSRFLARSDSTIFHFPSDLCWWVCGSYRGPKIVPIASITWYNSPTANRHPAWTWRSLASRSVTAIRPSPSISANWLL